MGVVIGDAAVLVGCETLVICFRGHAVFKDNVLEMDGLLVSFDRVLKVVMNGSHVVTGNEIRIEIGCNRTYVHAYARELPPLCMYIPCAIYLKPNHPTYHLQISQSFSLNAHRHHIPPDISRQQTHLSQIVQGALTKVLPKPIPQLSQIRLLLYVYV